MAGQQTEIKQETEKSVHGSVQSPFEAGVFLVDKPAGISSFAVVSRLRRILKIKKVGHAGTLDPFATGLLILCAGRAATKLISGFMDGEKEYLATVRLGQTTTTQDPEGEVVEEREVGPFSSEQVEECLSRFRGELLQVPPIYSALKHKGKPLYYYARKGVEITKEPRPITIHELERIGDHSVLQEDHEQLRIRVVCSKGTYIRTLGADIGESLGCGGHLIELRRTASGPFKVDNAVKWSDLEGENGYERLMEKMISVADIAKMLQ